MWKTGVGVGHDATVSYSTTNKLTINLMKTFFSNLTSHRWQYAAVLQAIAALLKSLKTVLGKYKQGFEDRCCKAALFEQWTIRVLKRLCCPTVSLTDSWSALNESLGPCFYHISAHWDTLGRPHVGHKSNYRCGANMGLGKTFQTPLWRLWTPSNCFNNRSHWKQEELLKAPEGSWWSSSDCLQEISVVHFRVLKFEETLYSTLFHSFHLPLSSFTSRSLFFEPCLWSS